MNIQRLLGNLLARYLRSVWSTSKIIYCPEDARQPSMTDPCIIAAWHGQHFLAPFVRAPDQEIVVLVAHGPFGSIYSDAFVRLGLKVIRGAGGKNVHQSGGYRGLREMMRALKAGSSVALTVDTPKVARIAGPGVIALARHSGRPIIPLAVVTRRRITLKWRWDRPTINLPFGHLSVAVGCPIIVAQQGNSAYFEQKRKGLEDALNLVNLQALAAATSQL